MQVPWVNLGPLLVGVFFVMLEALGQPKLVGIMTIIIIA